MDGCYKTPFRYRGDENVKCEILEANSPTVLTVRIHEFAAKVDCGLHREILDVLYSTGVHYFPGGTDTPGEMVYSALVFYRNFTT